MTTPQELFAKYPLAVRDQAFVSTMALVLPGPAFGVITRWNDIGGGRPYTLSGDAGMTLEQAVQEGVPLPRHGSLFGCLHNGEVNALVVFYTATTEERPVPTWTVMPKAGTPPSYWPPFLDRQLFGGWFWDYLALGRVVNLGPVVSTVPGAVWWSEVTREEFGSDVCVVAEEVTSDGWVLPDGVYAYWGLLMAGAKLPPADALMSNAVELSMRSF